MAADELMWALHRLTLALHEVDLAVARRLGPEPVEVRGDKARRLGREPVGPVRSPIWWVCRPTREPSSPTGCSASVTWPAAPNNGPICRIVKFVRQHVATSNTRSGSCRLHACSDVHPQSLDRRVRPRSRPTCGIGPAADQ